MTTEIRLLILIEVLPSRRDEQIAAFAAIAPLVRAEAGCLQYDLHEVNGKPEQFVLIERWSSQAALDAHDIAPHMLAAAAGNRRFRSGPVQLIALGSALN
ncbi:MULTISPECIES: putative quinol monooxygenase [unclassified Undibacterium]|uniref:putative quinol monooxygenase n=1 Tax=unclassified Undibacterium TaxID=2630295 RepID=UPI002AC8CAD5|nr:MULTISPECIES: putative quinol monooxygenase [unclassified Undibacterium]MEB0140956.1 putative quinol monooxygenase [Undibacterium sp. CCC2.1]MEB0173337.1 putative quinol monooxygenase [Undibacterium sp. CCC1.1]MEB0177912.1 putative quinol monooxygenase [Undibacterium sp. CCC3.4]MEB0217156.1 putative quinol monooxygenase [Undibacterium sp. 5I2]WPX43105.1 putative quinol monooxygenase [Undibacterium sp. CCC3.4]